MFYRECYHAPSRHSLWSPIRAWRLRCPNCRTKDHHLSMAHHSLLKQSWHQPGLKFLPNVIIIWPVSRISLSIWITFPSKDKITVSLMNCPGPFICLVCDPSGKSGPILDASQPSCLGMYRLSYHTCMVFILAARGKTGSSPKFFFVLFGDLGRFLLFCSACSFFIFWYVLSFHRYVSAKIYHQHR